MVAAENQRGEDRKGNPLYVAEVRGKTYCAVVALDNGGTDNGFEDSLRVAAERNQLDAEALIAISRAALAAPDRPVELDVGARLTA